MSFAPATRLSEIALSPPDWPALGGLLSRGTTVRTVADVLEVDADALRSTWAANDVESLLDLQAFLRLAPLRDALFYAENGASADEAPSTLLLVKTQVLNGDRLEALRIPAGLVTPPEAEWVSDEYLASHCTLLTEKAARDLRPGLFTLLQALAIVTPSGPVDGESRETERREENETFLCYSMLDGSELRAVDRLRSHLRREVTVADLLQPDRFPPRAGRVALEQLGKKLEAAMREPAADAEGPRRRAVVSRCEVSPPQLERILLEDIELFLAWRSSHDPRQEQMIRERWGFRVPQATLQEIGTRLNVTRQRVQQLEAAANEYWTRSIRVPTACVRAAIEPLLDGSLKEAFPALATAFESPERLIGFLELSSGVPEGSFAETQLLDAPRVRLLEHLFTETHSVIRTDDCVHALVSEYGMAQRRARQFVDSLLKDGLLEQKGDGIVPHALTQGAAVAHVLLASPNGMKFADITREANQRGLCAEKIPPGRTRAFGAKGVYLSDSGTYRHWSFLEGEGHDRRRILERVHQWLESNGQVANLHSIWSALGQELGLDYFRLRAFVSEYGEDCGLDFDGRSRADTVTLGTRSGRVTARDAVLAYAAQTPHAVTPEHVAEDLHLTPGMANLVLGRLADSGDLARVDLRRYATANRAFGAVDKTKLGEAIQSILVAQRRPVEAEVLRQMLERTFELRHSKYFYVSFVRAFAQDWGWHVARTLLSAGPIEYASLADAVRKHADPALSARDNVARIARFVLADEETVKPLLYRADS